MLSVLTALLSFTTPQDPKTALEVIPLHRLVARTRAIAPPPWGTLLRRRSVESPDLLRANNDEPQFAHDQALEMMNGLFQAEIDAGQLRIDGIDESAIASGDAGLVARVREQVRNATDQIARPLSIEACLWDAGGGVPETALLDPGDYTRFVGSRTPLWRSIAETRSDRPAALDGQRWTKYLRDADVEVAQKCQAANPITEAFGEGGRLVVRPHALVGGDDLVVFVQFGFAARRGATATFDTGVPGVPALGIPTLESTYGACSGRIRNGGALAIVARGHSSGGGQVVLTIRVTGKTPPVAQAAANFSVFPCSALCSGGLCGTPHPPTAYGAMGDEDSDIAAVDEQEPNLPPEQLNELVRHALGADGDETHIDYQGGFLFVRGAERVMPKVDALLRGLQDRLLQTTTVRQVAHLVPADGSAAQPALLHELMFPTMHGRLAVLSRILETNVVRDLHVEIAQEASILNPYVDALAFGSWVSAHMGCADNGCFADLFVQCTAGPPPQSRAAMPAGGNLSTVEVASTRSLHQGVVTKAQTVTHGDGPSATIDGQKVRTTLETTFTW